MRLLIPTVIAIAFSFPLHAAAQESIVAGGYGAGMMSFGAMNQPVAERPAVGFADGWVMTGSLEQRVGVLGGRATIGFTQRPFEGTGEALNINAWMGDFGAVLHPLGNLDIPFSPFAAAGIGFVRYGFGTGDPIVYHEAGAIYPGEEQARWAWTAGGGVDIAIPAFPGSTPVAIRGEFQHQAVQRSHFTDLDGAWYGGMSNQRFTLGLLAFVH
jgi:opacity protein-like surface antigen